MLGHASARSAHCGIEFTHDWLLDDLPCWMTTAEGPLLCLPYTWEINDVPMWACRGNPLMSS
jgi:hypothetical protein